MQAVHFCHTFPSTIRTGIGEHRHICKNGTHSEATILSPNSICIFEFGEHSGFQEGAMLSKCANPHCPTPFHYFREGKVIRVLRPRGLPFTPHSPRGIAEKPSQPGHNVEHFWLCGPCSPQYQIAIN